MRMAAAFVAGVVLVAAAPKVEDGAALQPGDGTSSSRAAIDGTSRYRWIHVPKTASSFANTVYRFGCMDIDATTNITGDDYPIAEFTSQYPPEQFCTNGPLMDVGALNAHQPWLNPVPGALVTMLREPLAQKISLLEFQLQQANSSGPGGCITFWTSLANNYTHSCTSSWCHLSEAETSAIEQICDAQMDAGNTLNYTGAHTPGSEYYAPALDDGRCKWLASILPRIVGCQSKMTVFGEACLQHHEVAVSQAGSRARYIKKSAAALFAFAGLTERYNESVCAFHQVMGPMRSTYGTGNAPIPAEFAHGRAVEPSGIDWLAQADSCSTASTGDLRSLLENDVADNALYEVAEAVYDSQLDRMRASSREKLHAYEACVQQWSGGQRELVSRMAD